MASSDNEEKRIKDPGANGGTWVTLTRSQLRRRLSQKFKVERKP